MRNESYIKKAPKSGNEANKAYLILPKKSVETIINYNLEESETIITSTIKHKKSIRRM